MRKKTIGKLSFGPGEENEKGLIVPRFGNKPENHVAVSMTFDSLSELPHND